MIDDGKYVVFKTVDFLNFCEDLINTHGSIGDIANKNDVVLDGTVLRDQDVFTSSALYTYANSILAAVEAAEAAGIVDLDAYGRLSQKAEFFMSRAQRAKSAKFHKLPD